MEWSIVSKAVDRSSRESREMRLTSGAARRSFTILRRAVLVLWPLAIGRLKGVKETIAFKMLGQLKEENLFSDLGKEGQVGDRSILL